MTGSYDPAAGTDYDSYGSYTVKNYFSDKFSYEGKLCVDSDNELDLSDFAFLYQQGKKNKAATFYDTEYGDYILGANKNDKYYFTNGGSDKAVDVKGNDTYNVASLSNSLIIDDKAGSRDKLVISDTNAHSLYFDITINNSTEKKITSVGKDLHIYNKDTHTKGVTIANHIAEYSAGDTVKTGAGCIESIKVGGNAISIDLNSVANSVAGWLGKNTEFTSTEALLDGGTAEQISTMLNIYTTGIVPN